MGWKWEVNEWIRTADTDAWLYEHVYGGPSLIQALLAARRAKKAGAGCVKVEWR